MGGQVIKFGRGSVQFLGQRPKCKLSIIINPLKEIDFYCRLYQRTPNVLQAEGAQKYVESIRGSR